MSVRERSVWIVQEFDGLWVKSVWETFSPRFSHLCSTYLICEHLCHNNHLLGPLYVIFLAPGNQSTSLQWLWCRLQTLHSKHRSHWAHLVACCGPKTSDVVCNVLQTFPHAPGISSGVGSLQYPSSFNLYCLLAGLDWSTQVISDLFVVLSVAWDKCSGVTLSIDHASQLIKGLVFR